QSRSASSPPCALGAQRPPVPLVGDPSPRRSHALRSSRTGAHHSTIDSPKYPENSPKLPRTCHVFLSGWIDIPPISALPDAAGAAHGEQAEPCNHEPYVKGM